MNWDFIAGQIAYDGGILSSSACDSAYNLAVSANKICCSPKLKIAACYRTSKTLTNLQDNKF